MERIIGRSRSCSQTLFRLLLTPGYRFDFVGHCRCRLPRVAGYSGSIVLDCRGQHLVAPGVAHSPRFTGVRNVPPTGSWIGIAALGKCLSRGATCLQRSRCHNSMHHHKPILRQHCAICSSAFNKVVLKERSRSSALRGPERKLFWSKSGIVRGFSALKARQHYVSARRQCVSACSSTSFRQCAEPTTIRAFTGASGADRHRPAGTERRGRSGQSGRHRSKHGSTLRLG